MLKNTVLLLKSQEDNQSEKYETFLMENGFTGKQCESLSFCLKNMERRAAKLKNPDEYEGIIFTNPLCVRAAYLVNNSKEIVRHWQSKYNFVVGKAT